MDKKGDLTSTQIVTLVIAIISFGIVLVALFLLNLGGYSAEDTCHLSVLTRATAPNAAQSIIPLKCVTKKICLSESASSGCKEEFAGEQNVDYVKITGNSGNRINQIEETNANAMYDCWSMMGEGKLDLFNANLEALGLSATKTTCVICSRVAIDKSALANLRAQAEKDYGLDATTGLPKQWIDINNYLKTKQVPGSSLTYLQTFTDRGVSSYASVKNSPVKLEDYNKNLAGSGLGQKGIDIMKEGISSSPVQATNQIAYVFMQIRSKEIGNVLKNMALVGGTIGAATFVSPVGKLAWAGLKRVIFTPWGAAAAVVAVGGTAAYGAYNAYQGQQAAAAACGNFSSNTAKAEQGCSMVQALDYHFNEINSVCGSIQGEL